MTYNELRTADRNDLINIVRTSSEEIERRKAADALIVFHNDYTYVDQAVA